jgi:hypothetical protein
MFRRYPVRQQVYYDGSCGGQGRYVQSSGFIIFLKNWNKKSLLWIAAAHTINRKFDVFKNICDY